jgi:hypothetical protein
MGFLSNYLGLQMHCADSLAMKSLGKNPAPGEPDAGDINHWLCQYIRGQSGMAIGAAG